MSKDKRNPSTDETVSRKEVAQSQPDWLDKIISHVAEDDRTQILDKDQRTANLLKDTKAKVHSSAILPLLQYIRSGDKTQQHDAAKAIGYMAKCGALNAQQKLEVKAFLIKTLQTDELSMGVAFAILEALERIDIDSFWTLVVGWYAQSSKEK